MLMENIHKKENLTNKKGEKFNILNVNSSIYYYHDKFQADLLKKIHKIKSLYLMYRYRMNKRKKYFQNNKTIISILISFLDGAVKSNEIKKVVQKFGFALRALNQYDAATMIQKCWRGYKIRKMFKKILKKLKRNGEDDF